ncbi:glycosyltransferase [Vibrio sp. 11986-1-5]|uniref:glycosyltransferase n=1 Tax=Vibrio sp. 11986-1-5 TaxID=2211215 RepID=UPI000D73D0E3|nr:glycosyltransferase [Vibrio sp. 11986-1-5]PXA69683.1 glycosyl transferase family 2 [Vibrio sp. 11986-1-5]
MKFSVLMSIYFKENPAWFNRAMQSIWDEQTVKPNEIILVQDGHLTSELDNMISIWKNKLGDILKCIPLENNVGLGDALNIGLQYCSNELVARMDTDDIAMSDRFEKQLAILKKGDIDICSSWITEFDVNELCITGTRSLPEHHEAIAQYTKLRNAINHPTVMYKKSAVDRAGGYQKMMWFEDYYLWVRMLLTGSKFYNIQEPLVHMRAGLAQLERRSGIAYARSELSLLKKCRYLGFLTRFEFYKAVVLRVPVRLMPTFLIRFTYKLLR